MSQPSTPLETSKIKTPVSALDTSKLERQGSNSSPASTPVSPRLVPTELRRKDVCECGRIFYVFRPTVESLLDTIFWGDTYKSIVHVICFAYTSWHGICGIRFLALLFAFHVWFTADRSETCSDEEAIMVYECTTSDIAAIFHYIQPKRARVMACLISFVCLEIFLEMYCHVTLWYVMDMSVGPLSVLTLLFGKQILPPPQVRDSYISTDCIHQQMMLRGFNGNNAAGGGGGMRSTSLLTSSSQLYRGGSSGLDTCRSNTSSKADEEVSNHSFASIANTSFSSRHRSVFATKGAKWIDMFKPKPSSINQHQHDVLTLYKAPFWEVWKKSGDITAFAHVVPWCTVRAGLYTIVYEDYTFEEIVSFINDDDNVKPVENLNLMKFDILVDRYVRFKVLDECTKICHVIWKRIVFGVQPRECPFISTGRMLTDEEKEHYHCGKGRMFMQAVTGLHHRPAGDPDVPPPMKGYTRSVCHRQGLIIREVPEGVELSLMLSGEPGGSVPNWTLDIARGEQIKILNLITKLLAEERKKK